VGIRTSSVADRTQKHLPNMEVVARRHGGRTK
jgi:hypothetical protein